MSIVSWYEIRDRFLGAQYVEQDISAAVREAAFCSHPEAEWLSSNVSEATSVTEVCDALREKADEGDARALCYFGIFTSDWGCIEEAAQLDNAFALAMTSRRARGKEKLELIERAVALQERDGFFELGALLVHSRVGSVEVQRELLLKASHLGHVDAMEMLGGLYSIGEPERYRFICAPSSLCFFHSTLLSIRFQWTGMAAQRGAAKSFLNCFCEVMKTFVQNSPPIWKSRVVYEIGRALKGEKASF